MPSRDAIVRFDDTPPPEGASPYVDGAVPDVTLALQEHDEAWSATYEVLAQRVRDSLGFRVLALEHVGSTAVPGLVAKPIIDLDLIVADPDREDDYVPALRAAGFDLRVREPWWYRHRLLRSDEPLANLHVWGFDSPEPVRHRIFRDWLRLDEHDRSLYAAAKQAAVKAATALGEDVNRYNERKSETLREVYAHAFAAAGLDADPARVRTRRASRTPP